jgi:hypothetical protein
MCGPSLLETMTEKSAVEAMHTGCFPGNETNRKDSAVNLFRSLFDVYRKVFRVARKCQK